MKYILVYVNILIYAINTAIYTLVHIVCQKNFCTEKKNIFFNVILIQKFQQ